MILTSKGRYAVMAMLEIARVESSVATTIAKIAKNQDIPHSYLEKLFLKLKNAGLIDSVRGPGGGYKLKHNPENISIYNVINAVEDDIKVPQCGHSKDCSPETKCSTHDLWRGLEKSVVGYLQSISLAEVISSKGFIIDCSANKKKKIYLDYNATAIPKSDAMVEMQKVMKLPQNPSSLHWHGRSARALIENARNNIAASLGIKLGIEGYQITFTASGTEANNLIMHNFTGKDIIISAVEHLSILNAAEKYGNKIIVNVDSDGQIDMKHFYQLLENANAGSLVSIIMANNETGILQKNLNEITRIAHDKGMFVHSDFVQSFGKAPLNVGDLDFVTISSHKIGGPIGAAALIHKTSFPLQAQICGGGQERGMRSGTENVAAIVGFAKAASTMRYMSSDLRDKMEDMIENICSEAIFYGKNTLRLPNTSMILMPGVDAQKQIIQFDLANISVSAGSACSSGKMQSSHVLKAMRVSEADAKCSIRVSIGPETTEDEVLEFVNNWEKIWRQK